MNTTERRTLTIDLDTGEWVSGGPITGEDGARVAASVLPGTTPELINQAYGEWLSDDPAGSNRARATEAVRAVLADQEALHCTRVWEAWQYGTMSADDFSQIADDDEAVAEIVAAAIGPVTLGAAPEIPGFEGTLDALSQLTIRKDS